MNVILGAFGWLLRFFNSFTGHYLLALLLFAILVKLILLPFGIKQQKTQIKGAKLRPKMALIEKKYAGRNDRRTLEKKQQEMLELQRAEGYSPLSGCLPLLIQLPLIIILYGVIQNPLTYICELPQAEIDLIIQYFTNANAGAKVDQITALSMLSSELAANPGFSIAGVATDLGAMSMPNFSIGPLDFATIPNFSTWLAVLPFLVFAAQFATMKLTKLLTANAMQSMQPQTRETKISGWIMDLSMPLMSLFFAFNLPGALGVYWIYQGALGLLQQFILTKAMPLPTFTEEEIREYERAMKGKSNAKKEDKPRVRSLHHIDDDDYEDLPAAPVKKEKEGMIGKAPMKKDEPKPAPKEKPAEASAEGSEDNNTTDGQE